MVFHLWPLRVTGSYKVNLIAVNIINRLNKVINQYNLDNDECIVSLQWSLIIDHWSLINEKIWSDKD
jgi:hypothetical protein